MKRIILFTLLIIFSISAKPQEGKAVLKNDVEKTTNIVIGDSVKSEIIEVAKKMAEDNEYISHKVKENRDKLEEMKKIEVQEDYIFSKVLKYLRRSKATPNSTIIHKDKGISYVPNNSTGTKVITKEKFYVKDSTCIEYDRNFFGIKNVRNGTLIIQN